jgi:hypothetical protein
MNEFSFGGAWSKGVGLFSGSAAGHALILIGLGIVAPFALQMVAVGSWSGFMNPALLGGDGFGNFASLGTIFGLAVIAGYVLQIGSYFGSWRLGLGAGENVAAAAIYGLIVALLLVVGFMLVLGLLGFLAMQGSTILGTILVALAFMLLIMTLYTVMAILFIVGMFLMLVLTMIFGAAMGQAGVAAAFFGGGSGAVVVVFLVILAVLLWLTARLSCTASVLASRRGFNLFGAMAESFRLTVEDQIKITGYLALIGLVLSIIAFVGAIVVGASVVASMGTAGASAPSLGMGAMILGLIVGIPFAYLTVLVPGGIYRELAGSTVSAEVFA